jgi:hypothetical protein
VPIFGKLLGAALTETLEVFFTALAFDSALRGFANGAMKHWILCGIGVLCCHPHPSRWCDVAVRDCALWAWARNLSERHHHYSRPVGPDAVLVAVITVLPLVPWTIRNWHVFHIFQPLAPRYANQEAEFVPMGFNHWVKTWIVDYVSTEEVYWGVPGSPMEVKQLPHALLTIRISELRRTPNR